MCQFPRSELLAKSQNNAKDLAGLSDLKPMRNRCTNLARFNSGVLIPGPFRRIELYELVVLELVVMRYRIAFLLISRAIEDNQPAIQAKLYRLEIVSIVFPATDRERQHINASGTRIDYCSHHTGGSAAPGLDYVVTCKVRFSPASLSYPCSELSALRRQNHRMIFAFKDGVFAVVFESRYSDLAGCRKSNQKRQS